MFSLEKIYYRTFNVECLLIIQKYMLVCEFMQRKDLKSYTGVGMGNTRLF